MGSHVVVSLGFPATEDMGEGTRDVRGQTRQQRHAPAAGAAYGELRNRRSLSSREHAEVCLCILWRVFVFSVCMG